MNYLDAAIGFTVVMATFAGAATAITEVIKRWQRTKARNLLTVLNGLQARLGEYKGVELSAAQRYELLREILNNPLVPRDGVAAATPGATDSEVNAAIDKLVADKPPKRIFNKVSTEHVCRRTAEALFVAGMQPQDIEKVLARVARDFDMLVSSVSTEFQNNFKRISIVAGVLIALFFNINAYRILDTFIQHPDMARAVASQMDELESEAEKRPATEQAKLADGMDNLRVTVDKLGAQGLPIGFAYGPHCTLAGTCLSDQSYRWHNWVADLLVLMLTGALLGLGAPFWFDVAKRLATVRSWFGGTPSAAESKAGREPGTSAANRKALAREIVEELVD